MIGSRWELVALILVLTTGVVPLAAILGMGSLVPVLAILGYVVLLPLAVLFGDRLLPGESADPATDSTPLERLRERYADGEIGHEEFEHRVERLIETERIDRADVDRTPSADDLELESE